MVDQEQERILQYTRHRFLSEGFYKISMDEIAAGLGISKKTLYKHFESKECLVERTIFSFVEPLAAQLLLVRDLPEPSLSKLCRLFTLVGNTVQRLNKKFLQDLRIHTPEIWKKVDEFRVERIKQHISLFLEQGKEEGVCADYPEDILMQILISLVSGVMNPDFLVSTSLSNREAFRMVITIFISGILTEKGREMFQKLGIGEVICEN